MSITHRVISINASFVCFFEPEVRDRVAIVAMLNLMMLLLLLLVGRDERRDEIVEGRWRAKVVGLYT